MSDAAAQTTNMAASVSTPQPFGPALGRFQAHAGAILAQPALRRTLPLVLGTLALALVALIYIMTPTPALRTPFPNLPAHHQPAVGGPLTAAHRQHHLPPPP